MFAENVFQTVSFELARVNQKLQKGNRQKNKISQREEALVKRKE
jgi:hypothetical protein